MAKLASIRALLSCDDDASASAVIRRRLEALGPLLLDCKVDAVIDFEVPPAAACAGHPGGMLEGPEEPDAVHVELRRGHLQLATGQRVVMDFGVGHFSAHLDDATHIARCLNAHHGLVAALRDAMHHLTLMEAGQKTPVSSTQMIEVLGQALRLARTPAVIETIAHRFPAPCAEAEAMSPLPARRESVPA